jgi:signal peptidase I
LENPIQPDINGNIKTSKTRVFFRNLFEIAQMLAMALVLYFIIDSVVGRVRVQKISMEPTLMPGEILLVNKLEYRLGEIERGDIVTFHYPLDPSLDYVKRVIGLPGDSIIVQDSKVLVNDQILFEPYISAPPEYEGAWEVPEGNIFVLGDNRNPSADSHVWGFVPLENLIGKAFAVYWPVTKIRDLPTPDIFASGN